MTVSMMSHDKLMSHNKLIVILINRSYIKYICVYVCVCEVNVKHYIKLKWSYFLGINPQKQMEIFRVLSGILHIGNVMFTEDEEQTETCFIPVSSLIEKLIHLL